MAEKRVLLNAAEVRLQAAKADEVAVAAAVAAAATRTAAAEAEVATLRREMDAAQQIAFADLTRDRPADAVTHIMDCFLAGANTVIASRYIADDDPEELFLENLNREGLGDVDVFKVFVGAAAYGLLRASRPDVPLRLSYGKLEERVVAVVWFDPRSEASVTCVCKLRDTLSQYAAGAIVEFAHKRVDV